MGTCTWHRWRYSSRGFVPQEGWQFHVQTTKIRPKVRNIFGGCRVRVVLRVTSTIVEKAALAVLFWVGYCLDYGTLGDAPNNLLEMTVVTTRSHSFATLIASSVVVIASQVVVWVCQEPSKEQRLISRLVGTSLDDFRKAVFRNVPDTEALDHNRVTLFQHVGCVLWIKPFKGALIPWGWGRHPWSGWLITKYRSGHATQKSKAVFLAPDDAYNCEGVAGQAWRADRLRVGTAQSPLPNLNNVKSFSTFQRFWREFMELCGSKSDAVREFLQVRETVEAYAAATSTTPELVWARMSTRKPIPTSILAIKILDSKNRPWGVLVMDSCNDYLCTDVDSREFRSALKELLATLTRLEITTVEGQQ